MAIKVCVFDAYGTLFDINAAARQCATEPGRENFARLWPVISAHWREKQLSYSWLLNILKEYSDFWVVTENALEYALESQGLASDNGLKERLLSLYKELETFSEVKAVLSKLNAMKVKCAILSNGSKPMLNSAVNSSGINDYIETFISADEVGVFKPDPKVYRLVLNHLPVIEDQVLFVSSNGWDIAGAGLFGFKTLWINRLRMPVDRLPFKPDFVSYDLRSVENYIK